MFQDKVYTRYCQIKDKFSFRYKKYRIDKLIAFEALKYLERGKVENIAAKELLKKSRTIVDYSAYHNQLEGTVITNQYEFRADYRDLVNTIQPLISANRVLNYSGVESIELSKLSIKPLLNFIYATFLVVARWKGTKIELKYLVVKLAKIFNTIDKLESVYFGSVKKFIAFNSSTYHDVYLTEYFNKRSIPTFSLQHAFQFEFSKKIQLDIITYNNVAAKTFLAWGKRSAQMITKYNNNVDIKITGNPRYEGIKKIDNFSFNNCIILLPRFLYNTYNIELLKEIHKLNSTEIKFSVKLHPTLNVEKYQEICNEFNFHLLPSNSLLTDLLNDNKYDFFITFNSSVYIECLISGKICFRYTPGENEKMSDLQDEFNTADELRGLIQAFQNNKEDIVYNTELFLKDIISPNLDYNLEV